MFTIEQVREKCKAGEILFSDRVLLEMKDRNISRDNIKQCLLDGEIVEEYNRDPRGESALISVKDDKGKESQMIITLVSGTYIITTCIPEEGFGAFKNEE